jgi:hypothetical protein
MIFSRTPELSPEARALLDSEREIPAQTPAVRARALARARAALVAGQTRLPAAPVAIPRTRWAVAAAFVCVASAAIGAAAYQIRARYSPVPGAVPAAPRAAAPAPLPAPAVAPAAPPSRQLRAAEATRASAADAARAELHLLRQARAAVAREDYAAALSPIAEHARRFKAGRLAEEREALRVKALTGLGRLEDARRAADAFEARFPNSVLLPAVSRMPASRP